MEVSYGHVKTLKKAYPEDVKLFQKALLFKKCIFIIHIDISNRDFHFSNESKLLSEKCFKKSHLPHTSINLMTKQRNNF